MEIQEVINDATIGEAAPWFSQVHTNYRQNLDRKIGAKMTQATLMVRAIADVLTYVGVQHNDSNAIYQSIVRVAYHRTSGFSSDRSASCYVSPSASIMFSGCNDEQISFFSDNRYVEQIWDAAKEQGCIQVRYGDDVYHDYFGSRVYFDNSSCEGQPESSNQFMVVLSTSIENGREWVDYRTDKITEPVSDTARLASVMESLLEHWNEI